MLFKNACRHGSKITAANGQSDFPSPVILKLPLTPFLMVLCLHHFMQVSVAGDMTLRPGS
jgi:hypothetical protein